MKLLYIANARIPTEKAHGIQIVQMCSAFANSKLKARNSKLEVELILPQRLNHIKKDPFDYYGIERIFKIKKLPCLDLIPLDKYIGHLGLWIESISFLLCLFPYILFKKADIIYTRDKLLLPLAFLKKNLIFEAHTFPKNYFLYSRFLKKLKGIVVITQKLKDLFVEKGIAADKILVAPDGVDLEKFSSSVSKSCDRRILTQKLNLPLDTKIILYTGHLYPWKGVQILAQAGQYLPDDCLVVFVGGTGEDVEEFRIKNQELSNILILGHRPYAEIPYWLKAADVLVLPNSGKQEISKQWTSPLKMFEYMAAEKPIVASDLPSIREILNENNALLVEPDNPQSLAQGIRKVLENKDLAERISQQAYTNVQSHTWQKRVEKILENVYFRKSKEK